MRLSPSRRGEISSWRLLDSWSVYVPWQDEKHWRLLLTTTGLWLRDVLYTSNVAIVLSESIFPRVWYLVIFQCG